MEWQWELFWLTILLKQEPELYSITILCLINNVNYQ